MFGCTIPTASVGAAALRARTARSRSAPWTRASATSAAATASARRGSRAPARRAASASAITAFTSTTRAAMPYGPASAASCATAGVRTCEYPRFAHGNPLKRWFRVSSRAAHTIGRWTCSGQPSRSRTVQEIANAAPQCAAMKTTSRESPTKATPSGRPPKAVIACDTQWIAA